MLLWTTAFSVLFILEVNILGHVADQFPLRLIRSQNVALTPHNILFADFLATRYVCLVTHFIQNHIWDVLNVFLSDGEIIIVFLDLVIECYTLFLNTNVWPLRVFVTTKFTWFYIWCLTSFFTCNLGLFDPDIIVILVVHLRKTNFLTISLKTFMPPILISLILTRLIDFS